ELFPHRRSAYGSDHHRWFAAAVRTMSRVKQADRSVTTVESFRPVSLDAINFLLADVRGALGPYLNVFLVTGEHWSQSEIGLVTTIGGFLGLILQTPAGALIDTTRAKRGFVVAA